MISVIISTYNRSEKLKRAVESVINQTFDDWELWVVDDASTDDTPDVMRKFISRDKRINYYRRTKNFGTDTAPKNGGILKSSGAYVSFLDDDNAFRPDHLQALIKALENNPDCHLAYGDRWIIDESGEKKSQIGLFSDYNPTKLMLNNYIDTSDVLIKRDALEYVGGFDERYKKYVDWNLWLRMAKAGYKFVRIPRIITDYYTHADQKSLRIEDTGGMNQPAWEPVDLEIRLPFLSEGKPYQLPRVAIFSITYNRLDYTKKCFKSLSDTAQYPYDHFIVDNGSTDGTKEWLNLQGFHEVIHNKDNKGISISSNQALDMIGEDYDIIMKIDNDCLFITEGWLKTMVDIWETNHMLAMSCYIQGLKDNPGGAPRLVYGTIQDQIIGMTRHLGGICHFVSSNAYKDFRWDEESPLHGVQDLELSHHLLANGYQMGYLENYFAEHYEGTEGQHKRYPEYFEKRKEEKVRSYKT